MLESRGTAAGGAVLLPPSVAARLIDGCKTLREAKQVHAQITTSPHIPSSVIPSLLRRLLFFCATHRHSSVATYAAVVFGCIPSPDLFSFNALIRAHANSRSSSRPPLDFYARLLTADLRPDYLTFPFLLNICAYSSLSMPGLILHSHVIRLGFTHDAFISNSLIFMYSTCGLNSFAKKVFDHMSVRDTVSWNSLLAGYLSCGKFDEAWEHFLAMEDERNVRTWNSMITGLVQGGQDKEALDLFNEMLLIPADQRIVPDKITVASVVSACATLGSLDQGKWVHAYLKKNKVEFDVVIGTALVDMYGKCGCLKRAQEVFNEMPVKDVLAWTAMISAFAIHGLGEAALGLLKEMERQGTKPNQVTFGAILSAFAHSGMVQQGRLCFDVMKSVYLIEPQPQHYACMVDLLGRAGLFEEAKQLIRSMPMEPDAFVWGALLGACRMYGQLELGQEVANHLISSDPENHAYYIILSDIYAKCNRFADVKRIRALMRDQGIKKPEPGCSMIEIDGQVHVFSVKAVSEVVMKKIQCVLIGINAELNLTSFPDDVEKLSEIT